MSHLFVGCRVRIECPISDVDGRETTVIGMNCPGWDGAVGDFLGAQVDIRHPRYEGGFMVFEYHELKPIQPSGAVPGIKGTCEPLDKLLSEVSRETV